MVVLTVEVVSILMYRVWSTVSILNHGCSSIQVS